MVVRGSGKAAPVVQRVFLDPSSSPARYVEVSWHGREVEVATGRVGSTRVKVTSHRFESEQLAAAFVEEQAEDARQSGSVEANPRLLDSRRDEPAQIPEALTVAALGVPLERVAGLAIDLYVAPPDPDAEALYSRASTIEGYTPVLLGPFAWQLVEEAAGDSRTPQRQRRAVARARAMSAEDRVLQYVSIAVARRPRDPVPAEILAWRDESILDLDGPTRTWAVGLSHDRGARLALVACEPSDVPLALPIHGGNAAPSWRELADVLASWHERYDARLRYTDASAFEIRVRRTPRTLEDLRRLAREHAVLCSEPEFRFPRSMESVVEERGPVECYLRAATQDTWSFAYD